MKNHLFVLTFLLIIMGSIPLAANKEIVLELCGGKETTKPVFADTVTSDKYSLPDNITFTDTASGTSYTRSAKSLIYSLTGAALDTDFYEQEGKAAAVICHTYLCCEYEKGTLAINTKNSALFLDENALKDKFGGNYTELRSYCDNVYDIILLQNGKPFGFTENNIYSLSSSAYGTDNSLAHIMAMQGNTYQEILFYQQLLFSSTVSSTNSENTLSPL